MILGNMTTLARPYAVAAFETALEHNALPAWEGMLNSAALVVQDERVAKLLDNPSMTKQQINALLSEVLSAVLDTEKTNFLRLLTENNRLPLLSDIALLFASYRAEHEKTIEVEVVSATELSESYRQKLTQALTKRFQRNVALQCFIDQALIGGAIVRAGDTVIDGSVRGKLNRLLESL